MPEIRSQYDRTRQTAKRDPGPGRTKQSMQDECDINKVVAMHQRTGSLTHINQSTPSYADYSNVPDYQEALNICNRAQESFNALPAILRKRFDNNPAELLAFLENPDNLEEAQELGLAETPPISIDDKIVIEGKNPPDPEKDEPILSPVDQNTP